jgi:hypothetical protein
MSTQQTPPHPEEIDALACKRIDRREGSAARNAPASKGPRTAGFAHAPRCNDGSLSPILRDALFPSADAEGAARPVEGTGLLRMRRRMSMDNETSDKLLKAVAR